MRYLILLVFTLSIFTFSFGQDEPASLDCGKLMSYLNTGEFEKYQTELTNELVGSKVQPFEQYDMAGELVSSKTFDGQILVLNFWFYPCPPCLREITSLNKLVEDYKDKDVAFVSFSRTDAATLMEKFFTRYQLDYINLPDSKSYCSKYCFVGFPVNMIADKNGIIQKIWFGGPMEDELSVYRNISAELDLLLED